MKIYISTDMEGISGVVIPEQVSPHRNGADYECARHLLAGDINAAVEGALKAGAEEITVMDGHGGGYNFLIEELRPGARYITGPGRLESYPGLDGSFDAVLLLGYHAMAGTRAAVLDHTSSASRWYRYSVNGIEMGEVGQAALIAGHYDVPVVFVSGDKAVCDEARSLLGDIEVAVVKEAFTRTCANLLSLPTARQLITEQVARSLSNIEGRSPYKTDLPAELKLETHSTADADAFERSGWRRLAGCTVVKTVHRALDVI
ncbi:MAG: M55 family metallopeptidase [bacterium]|nr:M55 family metallopeptidase [bacterium]